VYARERHLEILSRTRGGSRVEVKQLAHGLDVTPQTLRRDLTAPERPPVLRRFHRGVTPVELRVERAAADSQVRLAGQKERISSQRHICIGAGTPRSC
jgi:DeoR family transcriptional regulator, fructose operon transcriptional repressor